VERINAALNGLEITIFGPVVTALATLTEQFLKSDQFAKFRAEIDKLAASGAIEAWAKRTVFGALDAFAYMTRAAVTAFTGMVTGVISAFNTMQNLVAGFAQRMSSAIGAVSDFLLRFLRSFEHSFIGKWLIGQENIQEAILLLGQFKNEAQVAFHQVGQAAESAKIEKIPESILYMQQVMNRVATSVEQFSANAKKSFDVVKQEVTRTTQSADALTQPLDDATTEAGDLVKVSGGVGVMFDRATGAITLMNRELFGTLQLVREINAEGLKPVS
jgi:methyl-accepting chemotaxis protein